MILIAIIAFLIFERLPFNIYLSPTLENKPYYGVVASQPESAVLDLPLNIGRRDYNIASFYYNKPIVNGYFHYFGDGPKEREFLLSAIGGLARYTCSATDPIVTSGMNNTWEENLDNTLIQRLKENNIKIIVVHKDDTYNHPVCENVRMRISRLLSSQETLNPTNIEIKTTHEETNIIPSYTFTFPSNGKFYIDGLALFPGGNTFYGILKNGTPVDFQYSFSTEGGSDTITPTYQINTDVQSGDKITVYSDHVQSYSRLDLWYKFVASGSASQSKPAIEKIYDDENESVYRLN